MTLNQLTCVLKFYIHQPNYFLLTMVHPALSHPSNDFAVCMGQTDREHHGYSADYSCFHPSLKENVRVSVSCFALPSVIGLIYTLDSESESYTKLCHPMEFIAVITKWPILIVDSFSDITSK